MSILEQAKALVVKSRRQYDIQVKSGKYLVDRPLVLDDAINEIKNELAQ